LPFCAFILAKDILLGFPDEFINQIDESRELKKQGYLRSTNDDKICETVSVFLSTEQVIANQNSEVTG